MTARALVVGLGAAIVGALLAVVLRPAPARPLVRYQAAIACSGIEVPAETRLRVTVPVRITSGAAQMLPITGVEAARGAPPPPEFVTCVSGLITAPVTLSGPVGGKWPRTPDAQGDVLVLIGQVPGSRRAP
jgi:hypothetical protein